MSNCNNVPFLDLITPHAELEPELSAIFREALRTAGFIGGPMVENFEREFAAFCGTTHCVGVNSGTDALRFALSAAGVGKGDGVVTVPNTFIATTEAISQAGACPIFVEIDEKTYNMDVLALEEYLKACEFIPKLANFAIEGRKPLCGPSFPFISTDKWPIWTRSSNWQSDMT